MIDYISWKFPSSKDILLNATVKYCLKRENLDADQDSTIDSKNGAILMLGSGGSLAASTDRTVPRLRRR
ncbi:hypothetical protein ACS0PU_007209 [Formica fusca]